MYTIELENMAVMIINIENKKPLNNSETRVCVCVLFFW